MTTSRASLPLRPPVVLLGLLTAVDAIAIDSYIPALPAIQADLAVDASAVQSTLGIFFIGVAFGQAVWGPVSDRFGRRLPLVVGLLAYVAGSLLAVVSPNLMTLLAARFVQAIGASAGLVLARAVVSDLWPENEAARLYSVMAQVLGVTALISPLLGGGVLMISSWRVIFLLMTVLGIGCLLWSWTSLHESLPPDRRWSGKSHSWLSGYMRLMGSRAFVLSLIGAAFAMGAMFAVIAGSSFIFIRQYGWSSTAFSLLYAGTSAGFIIACQINVMLLRRYASATILNWGLAGQFAIAALFLGSVLAGATSAVWLAILMLLLVSVLGFILGNVVTQTMRLAVPELAGSASGLIGVAQFLLSAAITPLASALSNYALSVAGVTLLCAAAAWIAVLLAGRSE